MSAAAIRHTVTILNDDPLPGPVLYVKQGAPAGGNGSSWATAYNDLQPALAYASENSQIEEIWVAKGTYKPSSTGDRSATFSLLSDVGLYGGFAGDETVREGRDYRTNETILSGDLAGNDMDAYELTDPRCGSAENSYHVVMADAVSNVVLEGFTIRGGRADWPEGDPYGYYLRGAGVYCATADLTMGRCVVARNRTIGPGEYCGSGAGAYVDCSSRLHADSCSFVDNYAAFSGAGLAGDLGSEIIMDSTTVYGNLASSGPGAAVRAVYNSFRAKDCLLALNTSYAGASVEEVVSDLTDLAIVNCTFAANVRATSGATDLWVSADNAPSAPSVWNSVFQSAVPVVGYNQYANPPEYSHCDLAGCGGSGELTWNTDYGKDGGENIDEDPAFVRGYMLGAGSECIDRADDTQAPPKDMRGESRHDIGGLPTSGEPHVADMGAFEYCP